MKKSIVYLTLLATFFFLSACTATNTAAEGSETELTVETAVITPTANTSNSGMGNMSMGGNMMARHHATIPEEYAGLTNPVLADEDSLARGAEIYSTSCASCHGDGGMGDGPAAATLDPAPAPVAHTSQMLGDDYLFWRISTGGHEAPFNSSMVAWEGILDEAARWDVINYVQALGSGQVMPRQGMGGAAYDPTVEAEMQAAMLEDAVAQGIITAEEAAIFADAHAIVDAQIMQNRGMGNGSMGMNGNGNMGNLMNGMGNMGNMMTYTLAELVAAGELTQAQADSFVSIHDRLVEAGLMQ